MYLLFYKYDIDYDDEEEPIKFVGAYSEINVIQERLEIIKNCIKDDLDYKYEKYRDKENEEDYFSDRSYSELLIIEYTLDSENTSDLCWNKAKIGKKGVLFKGKLSEMEKFIDKYLVVMSMV